MKHKCVVINTMFLLIISLSKMVLFADWPTLAGNNQRTSWTSDEVRGEVAPDWYRPIDPYIAPRIQVVCANSRLYISSARGLYCLNASNGSVVWVYGTELPLGHSPTVVGNIIYAGGYDRRIHAIDNSTGQKLSTWDFYTGANAPQAGFCTTPLVANGSVYAGCRDGYFYAFDTTNGNLKWRYKTDDSITCTAAMDSSNIIYFASNDMYAYALRDNGSSAQLVWKSSQKMPGIGFFSYWPVIYDNAQGSWVIFACTSGYRHGGAANGTIGMIGKWGKHMLLEIDDIGTGNVGSDQTEPYPDGWASGTPTKELSKICNYYENKPYRRTMVILDRTNGNEYTFDSDEDGKQEVVPLLWTATHSGQRYPPVVGYDNVLYMSNVFNLQEIGSSYVTGWKFGTQYFSRTPVNKASDEPYAYCAGGDLIYWNICCSRCAGAFDLRNFSNNWDYIGYGGLGNMAPEIYTIKTYANQPDGWGLYGNVNGIYGLHGVQNPFIPYNGSVYTHKFNCVIAFAAGASVNGLSLEPVHTSQVSEPPYFSDAELKQRLATEVQEMISAGHLRPGYYLLGNWEGSFFDARENEFYSRPHETIWALCRALPYIDDPTLKSNLQTYIQSEFNRNPPYSIAVMDWSGTPRSCVQLPDDVQAEIPGSSRNWGYDIDLFYALWKYAQAGLGNASTLFNNSSALLSAPPSDTDLQNKCYIHNKYIAGYIGYVELGKLAEQNVSAQETTLNTLLSKKAQWFTKDSPITFDDWNHGGCFPPCDDTDPRGIRISNIHRNFWFMVPELADYLRTNKLSAVEQAVTEYNDVAPYWFSTRFDAGGGESATAHLVDHFAVFQAKAWILKESREELCKYLDAPSFPVGDLWYIHSLISALEAQPSSAITPTKVVLSASPSTLQADGSSTSQVRAEIQDDSGNLAVNATNTVTFSITSGEGGVSPAAVNASGGIATTTYTAGTSAGTAIIRGTSNGLTQDTVNITLIQNSAPTAPTGLQCEGQTNPTDVNDFTPDFTWTFNDPDTGSGDSQSAYRIIAADNQSDINSNNGTTWDSGKVTSSNSSAVYSGSTQLQATTQYWWKVKTWDNFDAEGVYSAVATFTTADIDPNLPYISVNPTTLDFGDVEIGKKGTLDFTITNTGGGTLSGSISTDKKWIEVQPTSFEANTVLVNVKVDNSILNQPEGKYTGKVSITSNGGNIDVEVTLVATCVLAKPNPYDPSKGNLVFFGDGIVPGQTTITIYTLRGDVVADLSADAHEWATTNNNVERSDIPSFQGEIQWNGTNENGEEITNGIYIYVYKSPNEQGVGKFTIIRR